MYCILVTGIPASGKSTMAKYLSEQLEIPVFSKDQIKELLFDEVGFQSRAGKVQLGTAGEKIMYYSARQLMRCHQPVILENNYENKSFDGMKQLLEETEYQAVTVTLTGDYKKIYDRFIVRNSSPDRHPGHVANDYYPRELKPEDYKALTYEQYVDAVTERGMDTFTMDGPHIVVDTSDLAAINMEQVLQQVKESIAKLS